MRANTYLLSLWNIDDGKKVRTRPTGVPPWVDHLLLAAAVVLLLLLYQLQDPTVYPIPVTLDRRDSTKYHRG